MARRWWCARRCCCRPALEDNVAQQRLLDEDGSLLAAAEEGTATTLREQLHEARVASAAAECARREADRALEAAEAELSELRCFARQASTSVADVEAELEGARCELRAVATAADGSLAPRGCSASPDELAACTRAVRQAVDAWETKLAAVRAALEDVVAKGQVTPSTSASEHQRVSNADVLQTPLDEVLAGMSQARASLKSLEDVRVSLEQEREALKAERMSLDCFRRSLEGQLARVSVGHSSLENAARAEAESLIKEIESCGAVTASLRQAADTLLAWEIRLSERGEHPWLAPPTDLGELGSHFGDATATLRELDAQLAPLLRRLLAEQVVRVERMPEDSPAVEAFVVQRLGPSPHGIAALADWGAVRAGMLLARVNEKPVPSHTNPTRLTKGHPLELKTGSLLTFVRRLPLRLIPHVRALIEDLAPVRDLLRLRSSELLPAAGPATSTTASAGGNCNAEGGPDTSKVFDPRILKAWESRLLWEAELTAFERQIWREIPVVVRVSGDADGAEDQAYESSQQATPGDVALSQQEGPKLGKGKCKGQGPPPPPGKGNHVAKAEIAKAGQAGPKGKGPPLLTGSEGLEGPKGKGPQLLNGPKGLKGKGVGKLLGAVDAVAQAAEKRKGEPLFGKRTRRPDATMMNSQKRVYSTFVSKCYDGLGIASIGDAFGERGRLLLHACIADAPGRGLPSETVAEEGAGNMRPELVQIVKGEGGQMGDKRRMDAEIRFRRLAGCGSACAGRGLVLDVGPGACRPCRATHEVAVTLAALDFEGLARCAAGVNLDLEAFLPTAAIKEDEEEDRAEGDRINQAFLLPQERLALLGIVQGTSGLEQGVAQRSIEELHGLERKLLPLAYVPSLAEKVKLYRVSESFVSLEREAMDNFSLAGLACDAVKGSKTLLDLLAVTLQIASYVKNFGDVDFQDQGFNLLKLSVYQGFWIGRYPFLFVLCAFLMNLRPRDRARLWAASTTPSVAGNPTATAGGVGVGASAARRRSSGTIGGEDSVSGRAPRLRKGPSFIERLDLELADARRVHRAGLTMSDLEQPAVHLERMRKLAEHRLGDEVNLFLPSRPPGATTPDVEEHAAELSAWAAGRTRLRRLVDELGEASARLRSRAAEMRISEQRLLEFASLRELDMKSTGYLDIIGVVLAFVDQLRQTWGKLDANPTELQGLQTALLSAAPIQMVFGNSCLEDAFNLWLAKASAQCEALPPAQWNEDAKVSALHGLFALFDANADGRIDAEELRVTLRALGVNLPSGSDKHYEVVRGFDSDRDGQLDFSDFRALVEGRIRATFRLFLLGGAGEHEAISEVDLRRVGERLGCTSLPAETYRGMLRAFSAAGAQDEDIAVGLERFEQLVLMRPDGDVGRVSSGHPLNRAASLEASGQPRNRLLIWENTDALSVMPSSAPLDVAQLVEGPPDGAIANTAPLDEVIAC